MLRLVQAAFVAGVVTFVLPSAAAAQSAPPPGALTASEILRAVEQRSDFLRLRELEWDEDGYWEVEFVTRDGSVRKMRIDPMNGQLRRG